MGLGNSLELAICNELYNKLTQQGNSKLQEKERNSVLGMPQKSGSLPPPEQTATY